VTRTHKEMRFLEPAHGNTEMGAIDGKDLKRFAFHPPHPAGNVGWSGHPTAWCKIANFACASGSQGNC